jgi:hypothetical protein
MNRFLLHLAPGVILVMVGIASLKAGPALGESTQQGPAPQRGMLADILAPQLMWRYDYDFPMSLEGAPGDYAMHEFRAFTPLPPVMSDTFVMLTNVNYRLFEADLDTDVLRGDFSLHTIRVPIQAAWLSPDTPWFAVAYVEPGLSTDFNVINRDSFDLSTALGIGYRFSNDFIAAVGVGYSRNYAEDSVFPVLGMLWRASDQFLVTVSPDGVVPEWRVNDDWRVKLKLNLIGGRWTIEDDEERERQLRLTGGQVSLQLEHRVFDNGWFTVGAGLNTLANLRIEDAHGRELLDRDLEEGLVLRSGLNWRF